VGSHGQAEFFQPPGRQVELDSGGAESAGALHRVVEERGRYTEHAVDVFLVVDRVPPTTGQAEIGAERLKGR
jgi:hypothetical protein